MSGPKFPPGTQVRLTLTGETGEPHQTQDGRWLYPVLVDGGVDTRRFMCGEDGLEAVDSVMGEVQIICQSCGGYGVVCHPDPRPASGTGTKRACPRCGGDGWLAGVLREGWEPDPTVLTMLDSYRWSS